MKISRRNAISQAIAGIFVIGLTPVSTAWATGVVAGATEPTQIANNVELVLQYAKQVQQYATQLQQWQNQIQNTLNIPNQIWSSIQNDLMGVMNIVKQGEALAFSLSNIGEQFKIKYPGFQTTTDYIGDYKKWSQTLRDTIKGTLEAANLQSQQFSTEEGVINQLRIMSQSNTGRLQALQTGNQIAVETTAQLQKLRALAMAQMQSQNAYMAKQEQERDSENASVDSMLSRQKQEASRTYKSY